MKKLLQIVLVTCALWSASSKLCRLETSLWLKSKCNNQAFQNNSSFFTSLSNCYPLVKMFPRCWHSYQNFMYIYNQTDIKSKCKRQCFDVFKNCIMMNSFKSTNECFHLKKLKNFCGNIQKKTCSKDQKTMQIPDENCSGQLIDSDEASHWVFEWTLDSIESSRNISKGCSLSCDSDYKVFKAGQTQVDAPIIILSLMGIAASIFTVLSFLVDWKAQNRYPAVILFILNLCFLMCWLGWVLQFFGLGTIIGCDERKRRRFKEPRSSTSIWCIISFLFIYFFAMAINCWFVVLNYAWFISFRTMGPIKVIIEDKVKYFHMISWSLPSTLTIMALWMQTVDAHPITNICFVLSRDEKVRDGLVVAPFTISIIVGELLLIQCVRQLHKLRLDCSLLLIPKAVKNITKTIYRLVFYGLGMMASFLLWAASHYQEKTTKDTWNMKNSNFVKCKLESLSFDSTVQCIPPDKSPVLYMHLQLLSFCMMCMMTSSWTWTRVTLKIWKKALKKRFIDDPARDNVRAQISWYNRMHKKKISPFIPPVNSTNPLEENNFNFIRHDSKRFSLPDEILRRNHHHYQSDDIRSVIELFSKRRDTFGSLQSVKSSDFISNNLKSYKSLSIQSFGHIAIAREIGPLKRTSSNLTVVQINNDIRQTDKRPTLTDLRHHSDKRLTTDFRNFTGKRQGTLDDLLKLRDKLYTPLTTVHKDNIVADCVPYARDNVDESLMSSVIELRKNMRSGRGSVDTIENALHTSTRL